LRADAEFALRSLPKQLLTSTDGGGFRLQGESVLTGAETSFHMQAWSADGRLLMVTPNTPKQRFANADVDGFTIAQIDNQRWRVFALWDDDRSIQVLVGQLQTWGGLPFLYALNSAYKTLIMFALFAPLTFWVVSWSLKPLKRVREDMLARKPSDLHDIDIHPVATELRPLVSSFNTLMQRLRDARQGEERFFADAAHELRTPLTALRLQAQVALREQDPALREAALTKLVGGIDRTTRMAEQLLDFAKADSHDGSVQGKVNIDVGRLVQEMLQLLNWDINAKQLRIETHITPCELHGNQLLLSVALRNVLDNAIRYSPPASVVKITAGLNPALKEISIAVADQGPGIAETERHKVTGRFYRSAGTAAAATAAAAATGSGLGLSIVERVCALHAGRLVLSDADTVPGLKVTLIFPARSD
jgi:signal transduction histidine kinase